MPETRLWQLAIIKSEEGENVVDSLIEIHDLGATVDDRKNLSPLATKKNMLLTIVSISLIIIGLMGFVCCAYYDHLKKLDTEKVLYRIQTK